MILNKYSIAINNIERIKATSELKKGIINQCFFSFKLESVDAVPSPMPRSADFRRKPDVFAVRLHVQRNTPAPTSGLRQTHRWKSFLTSIFGEIAERKQFVEAS